MGILAGILRPDGLKGGRSSAVYKFKNTDSISSDSIISFDLEVGKGGFTPTANKREYQGFYPFRNVSILNNDVDYNVEFIPNNAPEHAIAVLNRGAQDLGGMGLIRFQIKNIGSGTIGPGKIIVSLWNE